MDDELALLVGRLMGSEFFSFCKPSELDPCVFRIAESVRDMTLPFWGGSTSGMASRGSSARLRWYMRSIAVEEVSGV